tara:strand:+ start:1569 stop:2639 length:1071 start_codon:yes stop_codon:yes gene_type:complete
MAYISFQPSDYFNSLLWSGNGSAGRNITGVGFQPDWVWIKNRSRSSNHTIVDVTRGSGSYPFSSTQTSAEDTGDTNQVSALISDGITIGSSTNTNANSENLVGWFWRAGGGAGSSNTAGTINTTTTSVNTTAGFSISTYTGTGSASTIGHGLGVAPKVVMIKRRDDSGDWRVFTEMTGNQSQLSLNQTSAADSSNTTMWNSTSPTTTTFSIGTHSNVNSSGGTFVAYCFAEIKGYSKFGSYKGNGSTWGPFLNCGFKPAWVLWKRTDSANGWILMDNKRPTVNSVSYGSNPQNYLIEAQSNGAEATDTSYHVNFLSNGFKIRNTNNVYNNTSGSYIFMAFAEHPLVSSNGVAATGN